MALNIKDLVSKATALRTEIQAAVADGEHIIKTAKGDVETGQLVVAAGQAHALIVSLTNHATAAEAIVKANGAAPAPAAAPATEAVAE